MAQLIQLSFPQGDDKTYTFTMKGPSGDPIDITGSSVESHIRATYDGDLIAEFECVVTDPANGKFSITLDNETSAALPVRGSKSRFVFDVEITYGNGTKSKVVYGSLVILREVTR